MFAQMYQFVSIVVHLTIYIYIPGYLQKTNSFQQTVYKILENRHEKGQTRQGIYRRKKYNKYVNPPFLFFSFAVLLLKEMQCNKFLRGLGRQAIGL